MNYDLRDKEERKRFVNYANMLLRKERPIVKLKDETGRTLDQNSYIHVLCRILAVETGVTEYYAKQVYFKEMANPGIFIHATKDRATGKVVKVVKSTAELTIPEASKAIKNLHKWTYETFEGKLILPEATLNDDGSLTFKSDKDKEAYNQARVSTSKYEQDL